MGTSVPVAALGRLFAFAVDAAAAQRRMAPAGRRLTPPAQRPPPRRAAALAYLFERGGGLRLPLTVRRADLAEHAGQVALPGGRPLPGEGPFATALREAREEIDLPAERVQRLGALEPVYIPVTHTWLEVQVGAGPDPGPMRLDPEEVARLVVVDPMDLLDPARRRVGRRRLGGELIEVPFYDLEGLDLWGATAMALSELAERLRLLAQEG